MVIYDADLKITYINEATTRLTGRPQSDFIGKHEEEIWPPEIYSEYLPTLKAARDTGISHSVDIKLSFKDGQTNYLHITCVPLMEHSGKAKEILGITHDLTEHYRAEAEKAEYENRIRQAQKMESIGNLAGGIAHDFNNILSSVIGFTELALDDVEKDYDSRGQSSRSLYSWKTRKRTCCSNLGICQAI